MRRAVLNTIVARRESRPTLSWMRGGGGGLGPGARIPAQRSTEQPHIPGVCGCQEALGTERKKERELFSLEAAWWCYSEQLSLASPRFSQQCSQNCWLSIGVCCFLLRVCYHLELLLVRIKKYMNKSINKTTGASIRAASSYEQLHSKNRKQNYQNIYSAWWRCRNIPNVKNQSN